MRTTKEQVNNLLTILNNCGAKLMLQKRNGYYAIDRQAGAGAITLECGLSLRECLIFLKGFDACNL